MPRRFAQIAFGPAVRALQERLGSRAAYAAFDDDANARDRLTEAEVAFVAARDSFYLASVGENGWPYVQHRGGPPGFLRVLDEHTLGFADFRGNRQYITTGNVGVDDRVALILMDYPNRARLKIWARARVVDADEDPALLARLEVPTYRARVERGFVFRIEALDWNCPQHITPRYTEEEFAPVVQALEGRIAGLQAELEQRQTTPAPPVPVADAARVERVMRVADARPLTPEVRALRLVPEVPEALPIAPGAHVLLQVVDSGGRETWRSYSLTNHPWDTGAFEIAVRLDPAGAGGSRYVHGMLRIGDRVHVRGPSNHFALQPSSGRAVLLAGGIGLTPLLAMARALDAAGRPYELHIAARSPQRLPLREAVEALRGVVHVYYSFGTPGRRMAFAEVLGAHAPGDQAYVCGPPRFIEAARQAASAQGWPAGTVRSEAFTTIAPVDGEGFDVTLQRSGRRLRVESGQSLLDALLDDGQPVDHACRAGECGSCRVPVLAGTLEHRDTALSEHERVSGRVLCSCISRAHGELVLDL